MVLLSELILKIQCRKNWKIFTYSSGIYSSENNTYEIIVRQSIIDAKKHHHRFFDSYKSNLNKTWRIINKSIGTWEIDEFPTKFTVGDRYLTDNISVII